MCNCPHLKLHLLLLVSVNCAFSIPQKTLFHPLFSLRWQSCKALPEFHYLMGDPQAVVLNNKVYVDAVNRLVANNTTICIYDISGDSWETIQCATFQHALTAYNNQLVLVGGCDHSTRTCTNELSVLQNDGQKWTQPFPPMLTKRYDASAIGIGSHLAVAGGYGYEFLPLDTVEIYDGHTWKVAQSLPKPSSHMKSVLQRDIWYLMGGDKHGKEVYYAQLKDLLATTASKPEIATPIWKRLPDIPYGYSTPAVFKNELIAIGGEESIEHLVLFAFLPLDRPPQFTSKIHAYSTSMQSWVHVGDMPTACDSTCATTLPSGELFLVKVESVLKGYSQGKP